MNRGKSSDSLPNDLILEILSRLPAKSTGRFRCVSKLWGSMLHKPYFTELFLTRSSARPRVLIGIHQDGERFFYSAPQPQNPYEKSSIIVDAKFHLRFGRDTGYEGCRYASGMLYFTSMQISSKDKDTNRVICNPITRQFGILPRLRLTHRTYLEMLGFDQIGKQFKVLSMKNVVGNVKVHYILTVGTENMRWRKIQCPFNHYLKGVEICISGVLYYLAYDSDDRIYLIGCFDVRYEEFTFLNLNPHCSYQAYPKLVNYKGKLGVISLKYKDDGGFPLQLFLTVLEDVEKQEWSTYVYTLRDENKVGKDDYIFVVGMTALGEIVLAKNEACKPFYVFYFNPERNTLLSFEIQNVGENRDWFNFHHTVCAFVDHVEDLQFNIMKKASISPPKHKPRPTNTSTLSRKDHQVKTIALPQQDHAMFESTNKFNALCLLDDDE